MAFCVVLEGHCTSPLISSVSGWQVLGQVMLLSVYPSRTILMLIVILGVVLIIISITTSVHAVNRLWPVVPGRGNGFHSMK